MSNDNDWLKSVKEGDVVFYEYGGFASRTLKPMTVERTTKTQIMVNGTKYHKENGREVGERYSGKRLLPYNDENKHAFEVREKRLIVDRQWDEIQKIVKPRYIPEDKLEEVSKILEQLKKVVG